MKTGKGISRGRRMKTLELSDDEIASLAIVLQEKIVTVEANIQRAITIDEEKMWRRRFMVYYNLHNKLVGLFE